MKTKNITVLLSVLLLLLVLFPSGAYAAGHDNGLSSEKLMVEGSESTYYLEHWTSEGFDYYKLSEREGEIGAPTFYSGKDDVYENESGIRITFFQRYDSATPEQAKAFRSYLMRQGENRYCSYYYYINEGGRPDPVYVVLFEGIDFDETEDFYGSVQRHNPWTNQDGTKLELEYISFGDIGKQENVWKYAQEKGCSEYLWVNRNQDVSGGEAESGGISFGMRFTEDSGPVMKYCSRDSDAAAIQGEWE